MKNRIFKSFSIPVVAFFCLAVGINTGCKEDSLLSENPAPNPDNVLVQTSLLYYGNGIDYDSLYQNKFLERFYIDSIKVLMSKYYFVRENGIDTVDEENYNFAKFPTNDGYWQSVVGDIPEGDYAGRHYIILGTDSLKGEIGDPVNDPNGVLTSGTFSRQDPYGVDFLKIYGRVYEYGLDTVIHPIMLNIGSYLLTDTISSPVLQYFVASDAMQLKVVLQMEVGPMLNAFSLLPPQNIVLSDPTDIKDMQLARILQDSLAAFAF